MGLGKSGPGWLFLAAMLAVTLTGPLSIHAFLPALPFIQDAFDVDAATAQLTFSVVLITMAVSMLAYGTLSDRYGRRRVLLVGLALFIVGAVVCMVAPGIDTLIAGRFIQATGAAGGIVLARAMARDVYGDERLVKVLAYLTMAYVLGPMLAPTVGGALIDAFGWRALFTMAIAGGVAIMALVIVATPETAPAATSTAGPGVLESYARLVRNPRFMGYALHNGFASASFYAYISAASFLMRDVLQRPAAEYGLYFLSAPGFFLVGNFIAGRLGGRVRIDVMVVSGSVFTLLCALAFPVLLEIFPLGPTLLFSMGAIGSIGQGMSMPNAQSGGIIVEPDLTGTASGVVMFMAMFIGAIGAQLAGFTADGTAWPMAVIYIVCCALALAAGLMAMMTRPKAGTARA